MQMRNFAAVAALTAAVVGITAGTANAQPTATPAAYPQKAVHYTIGRSGNSEIFTATDGQLKVVTDPQAGRQLEVLNNAGTAIAQEMPLTYRINNTVYNEDVSINGHTATITPNRTPVGHVNSPLPVVHTMSQLRSVSESFTPRDQTALSLLGSRATTESLASSVTGAVIGGGVGCLVGAAAGSAVAGTATGALLAILTFLGIAEGAVAGCIVGASTLASLGTVAGLIFIGGPLILFSAIQYFSTVLSPCLTPGAYCKDPAQATH